MLSPSFSLDRPPRLVVAATDPDELRLLDDALDQLGAAVDVHVVHSPTGVEALLADDAGPAPDLVLLGLDSGLDPVDGVVGRLRALRGPHQLVVVVLSAPRSQAEIARTYAEGANAVVDRPLRHDDLLDALQRTLDFWLGACHLPMQERP